MWVATFNRNENCVIMDLCAHNFMVLALQVQVKPFNFERIHTLW